MTKSEQLLAEMNVALGDILVKLEDEPKEDGKDESAALIRAVLEGLSKLKISPSITVQPAALTTSPITVNVPPAAAPVVHMMAHEWKELDVEIIRDTAGGNARKLKITKK